VDPLDATAFATPPLIGAALFSSVEMLRLLLASGADVDDRTRAADTHDLDPEGSTALGCALGRGRIEFVRDLLAPGGGLNARNEDNTPHTLATRFEDHENHVAMVRALLDAGGSPHHKS